MKPTTKLDHIGSAILFGGACLFTILALVWMLRQRHEQIYPQKESNYATVENEYPE